MQPRLRVLFLALMSGALSLITVGGIVSFLFLGGACSAFCILEWVIMGNVLHCIAANSALPRCLLLLAGAGHVDRAGRGCLACNGGAIGDETHMRFQCAALARLRQHHADPCTPRTDTMRSFARNNIVSEL